MNRHFHVFSASVRSGDYLYGVLWDGYGVAAVCWDVLYIDLTTYLPRYIIRAGIYALT